MAERTREVTKSIHRILESNIHDVQLIKYCLKFKTNPMKILDRRKRSPLHSAARGECSIQIFRLLTEFKKYINDRDHWGCTPLHYAIIKRCSTEVFEELIRMGADVELKNICGELPLFMAVNYNNDIETLKVLIKAGAKIRPIFEKREIWKACAFYNNKERLIPLFLQDPSILLSKGSRTSFLLQKLVQWAAFHDHQYTSDIIKFESVLEYHLRNHLSTCVRQVKELQDFDRTHNCSLHHAVKGYCTLPLHSAEWFRVLDNASEAILDFDRPSEYFEEIAAVQKAFVVRRTYQLRIMREGSRPLDLLSSNRVVDFLTSDEDRMNLAAAYDPQLPRLLARNLEAMKQGQI